MVFINGKNNLEIAGLYNVNQLEKVGSTADMNIVAEIGRMAGQTAAGLGYPCNLFLGAMAKEPDHTTEETGWHKFVTFLYGVK